MSEIGWIFPINDDGEDFGINDAGIETFREDPIASLARETVQNSLDAKVKDTVKVHFDLFNISQEQFPDGEDFIEILQRCLDYWKGDSEAELFFNKGLKLMKGQTIPVLKIGDYNTTGLTGSYNDKSSKWRKLVKSSGSTNKEGDQGGSYGIGKNASFLCSDIKTVFISTLDKDGDTKFQGVAKLGTHENRDGQTTLGTGYFGIIDKKRPIKDFSLIKDYFRRKQQGTDLFVVGFNELEEWDTRIIKSIIDNYFIALHKGFLEVKVGNVEITAKTFPALVTKYIDNDGLAGHYYKALTTCEKPFIEENFNGKGRIELYVIEDDAFTKKKIAMVRRTGMKIFDKEFRIAALRFAGVLLVKGKDLNEYLRRLEPPSHNAWSPGILKNPKERPEAKKFLESLYGWVRTNIMSLVQKEDIEELDVDGMSEFLPDDMEEVPINEHETGGEGEKGQINNIEKKNTEKTDPKPAATSKTKQKVTVMVFNPDRKNDKDKKKKEKKKKDKKPRKKQKDDGTSLAGLNTPQIQRSRAIFDQKTGSYTLIVVPESDGRGFIKISIAGDDDANPAPIKSVTDHAGKELKFKDGGKIGPLQFVAKTPSYITLTFEDPFPYALEVTGSAD